VPRARPAPDGRPYGGNQPTDIRRINRRLILAPALPLTKGTRRKNMEKHRQATLDLGSHTNAGPEPLPEAGAERTVG
jgi:hypothetical protein